MQLNIRDNYECWNREAAEAYAAQQTEVEDRLSGIPVLTLYEGELACSGCVYMQGSNKLYCTLQLAPTEVTLGQKPRGYPFTDVFVSAETIQGFRLFKDQASDVN